MSLLYKIKTLAPSKTVEYAVPAAFDGVFKGYLKMLRHLWPWWRLNPTLLSMPWKEESVPVPSEGRVGRRRHSLSRCLVHPPPVDPWRRTIGKDVGPAIIGAFPLP